MANKQDPAYAQIVDALKDHSTQIAKISEKLDVNAFDKSLHPDWFMIDANGQKITKQQELDSLRKSEFKPTSIHVSDLHVEVHGDTAVVTGVSKVSASFQGKDISGKYRFTQIYKSGSGQSLLAAAQAAPGVRTASALPSDFVMLTCIAMATA